MGFEPVYTMPDWYDGPRGGVASFNGKPHVYVSCWNDIDSREEDVFLLSEISQETLVRAIEDWEIWLRWRAAFDRGETTIDTHPCLPEDRSRHDELERRLKTEIALNESLALAATAEFRYRDKVAEVQWTVITLEPRMDRRVHYRWASSDEPDHTLDTGDGVS